MAETRFSVRENKMAGKSNLENKNSKPKTVKLHTFAPYALLFAFFVYALLPTGCVETTDNDMIVSPQKTRITQISDQEKKQKLLRELERKFENPNAHFELGQLYQAEGLLVAAEYHYNIALRFDPVHRDSQAAMVKMMKGSGETEKARLQAAEYMRQVSTSSNGSRRLALAFQKQGLDEYVLPCYQQAIRIEPNSAENYKQIGYYYLSKSDKVRARDFLTRSYEIKPNQPDVALTLGQLGVEIKIPQQVETNPGMPEKSVE
jgi:tetratricopeptide (TPR) repeat protein